MHNFVTMPGFGRWQAVSMVKDHRRTYVCMYALVAPIALFDTACSVDSRLSARIPAVESTVLPLEEAPVATGDYFTAMSHTQCRL